VLLALFPVDELLVAGCGRFGDPFRCWRIDRLRNTGITRGCLALGSLQWPRFPECDTFLDRFADFILPAIS
jgi:hypothetical protein